MSPLSRREVLRTGVVACGAGIAGCLDISWSDDDHEARLTGITFENHTDDEQSVLVIVEDDGEQVYGDFTAVPPADDEPPTIREVSDLPDDAGVYDVFFNLARRPEDIEGEYWARADNTAVSCREYRVAIRDDEDGEPQFGVYRSEGC